MLTHNRQTWSRMLRPAAKHLLAPLLVLCALSALSQNYPTQTRELPPVTITEERARDLMRQLTDLDAFMHSVGIENIAKDERLEAYATGFAERNQIEVFTIGYINSDELWPRVFRNIRLKKLNNAATDQLLAAHILFIPQTEGYTVELKLEGKTTEVYELLELTEEEVTLIAKETSAQQLGSTTYTKPKEARETVVNALIAALEKVEQKTDPEAQALSPVTFQPASNQHYGFDAPVHEQLAADYPTVTIAGETLRTAWKSLKQGTPDPVLAQDDADQNLTFEYNGAPLTATSTDNTYTLQPVGGADGATGELIAKVGEYTAGVLQTISYAEVLTKVTIVPVNGAGSGITQSELQKRLNEIYGPAVASWQVEVMDNQTLTGWDDEGNGLDDGETGMLSNYTDEMNALIRAFKAKHKRARDTYYLFLVDRAENTSKLGYMPRKKQWGFVFTASQRTDRLITTIAHELGHGVFRLEHTFSEKGLPKGQTDNLMDYSDEDAKKLYKYQWDHVHDPASVVTLFDDEEDGAMEAANIFDALFEESDIDVIQTEDAQTELTSGGIILTYKGHNVTFNGFRVTFSLNPGNGELTISQIVPRFSPDNISTINILIARATNRFQELLEARDDYPPFENVSVAELAMEEEAAKIKEFLAQTIETLNQEGDQLEDFIGLPEEEKEKLKAAIADFKDNQDIDSKVTVLDEATFDELKDAFTPEKEVHLLLGKTAGGYKKQFYYQEDFFNYPTGKTTDSGESISLDYQQSDVEAIRDQHIDKSIDNSNSIGELTKKPEPTLNIFERGMWVVKVTKETLAEIKVPVPMWNSEVETDTYPFELNSLTAGLGDGAVDELKSIPDLLVLTLSLFDEQERTALLQTLEQLDYGTVKKMFHEKADKYAGGGDVAFHEAGYDGVQIASMFWGGAFIKGAKKGSETAEAITDVLKKLPNSVTDKLADLSDVARRTLLEDLGKSDQLLEAFSKNADLIDSWRQMFDANISDVVRSSIRNLQAVTKWANEGIEVTFDAIQDGAKVISKNGDEVGSFITRNGEEVFQISDDFFVDAASSTGKVLEDVIPLVSNTGETFVNPKFVKLSDGSLGFVEDVSSFGSQAVQSTIKKRGNLRKALTGISKTEDAHHLIPVQLLKENDVVKKAVEAGFDFNGTTNGLAIEKFVKKTGAGRHGPHPKYTDQLRDHLDWWARQPGNDNFTPDDAKTYLDALTNNLKTKINTSSSKINDLALGLPK